jgi:hypothetical protein
MKRKVLVSLVLVLLLFAILAVVTPAQRAIPDDNLAYPVLLRLPNGLASGFYLNNGTSIFLVTAKHVLFNNAGQLYGGPLSLLSYSRDPKETGTNQIELDLTALSAAAQIKPHPTADVAVIRIASLTTTGEKGLQNSQTLSGVTVRSMVSNGLLGVGLSAIKKYQDVLIANEVLLFGYPTSLGMQEFPQLDPWRPLLRRGIIAGLNPSRKSIVVDCPSYPGNSGGPVVEVDHETFQTKVNVIGVVSEFVPFAEKSVNFPIQYQNTTISNSGYTIVTPMDSVLELLK